MKTPISILVLFVAVFMSSCKQETKETPATSETSEVTSTTTTSLSSIRKLEGEFYYNDEASVFKGKTFIYGVQRDAMAEKLAEQTKPNMRDQYDMIPVIIKGEVQKNPAHVAGKEGWEEIVIIKEIVDVLEPTDDEAIKIESGS